MKRRTMLAGLGMLATGSGTVVSSAALADSTTATTDIRVISKGGFEVRAGPAFADDGSVNDGYTDDYVAFEDAEESMFFQSEDGLNEIEKEDLPVATVNPRDENVNADLEMEVAISTDQDVFVFEDILEIENTTGSEEDIGIGYDRAQGQYGDDVDEDGEFEDDVTPGLVQHIYRFRAEGDTRISPNPDNPDEDFPDDDEGGEWYSLGSGETVPLNLRVDLTDWEPFINTYETKEILRDEADEDPFSDTINTVDLLDGITVGTRPE